MNKHLLTSLTVSAFLPLLVVNADQPTLNEVVAEPQAQDENLSITAVEPQIQDAPSDELNFSITADYLLRPAAEQNLSYTSDMSDSPAADCVAPQERLCTTNSAADRKHFCNTGFFFTADYLLWQATEQNLNYGSNIGGNPTKQEQVFDIKFNWQSGFRVGVGYNIGHDQWDTNITWTWFEDDASGHAKGKVGGPLIDSANNTADFGLSCLKAKSDLELHLNLLDWELGKEFYSSKWVSLRPFAGLRTGWVNQNWVTEFSGQVSTPTFAKKYTVDLRQEFWGIGLRGGLDTEWGLIRGLSLYADGAISLLYGFFEDTRFEHSVSFTGADTIRINGKSSKRCEQAITELQMGLRWNQMFSDDRYRFRIQAGWNHMVFFDHNHQFYFTAPGTSIISEYGGNLGFQGWSAAARFDF